MKLDGIINIITILLVSIINVAAVEGYEVTITITPPTGPYLIDRTIDLSCFINPTPPDPVIYRWRILSGIYNSWEPTNQNISFSPNAYDNFHYIWFYCQVFSNAVQIAEGEKAIEVYGFVYPLEHPVHTFTHGETVSLRVNISNTYSAARHIQSLAWYHNGSQICSCRTRNNGTELVIPNAKSNDAGIYQVKISALDFGRPDCDARILPEIEFFAMSAPVTFVLTQDPIYEYNPLKFLPRKRYFTINGTNAIELSNEYCFHANTTQTLAQYHYEAWYQNGTYISINNAKYNSTVIIKQNGELIFTIEISNVSGTDQGNYVGIISGRINDLTRWCNEYRYSFLPYSYRFFYHYDLPIAISYSSIEVYRPPSVMILSSKMAALLDENVHIKCSTENGNPDLHNITLLKNNAPLMVSTQTDSLTYDTKGAFGLYTCIVESLYTTATESLLLQEKANFQLFLDTNTHGQCILFLNDSATITSSANEIIQRLCDCSATVQLASLYCTSEQSLMLKGTVTYSDLDGNFTATAVVDILQEWILTSETAAITIDGNVLELSKSCPTRTNSLINKTCQAFPVDSHLTKQIIGYISGSFIGGVITGSFISVLTMLICFRFRIRTNVAGCGPATRNKEEKEEEVVMGTNEAYEAVALRYQQPASVLQGNIQEEPVYELAITS